MLDIETDVVFLRFFVLGNMDPAGIEPFSFIPVNNINKKLILLFSASYLVLTIYLVYDN